ncbi:MAG: hypothetical protein RI945_227 [Candidatus Parcubacteria bacterium]|jgi:tetratricopeptide (TPR) repeat protein
MKNTKISKSLKWIIYTAISIIPFLAFYVSGFGINASWNSMLFPYITGKNFAFRILVEIAAASWLMLMIIDKSYRPRKSLILYIYSAFIFILLLADIFSINPTRAFFSNFERMEGFISHAHLFLYFLIMVSMFKNKVDWSRFKRVLYISNIPVILLAFLQLLGLQGFAPMKYLPSLRDVISKYFAPSQGGTQLDSSLGNSTYLAIYSVFFIFLFFSSYLESKIAKNKNSWKYLLMVILNFIVLYYTQTRGAQIGFLIGVFVSAIIIYFGGKKFKEIETLRKISLGVVLGIVVIFIALISLKNTNIVQNSSTLNKLAKVASFANPINVSHKIGDLRSELYNPSSTYKDLYAISNDGTFTSRLLNIKMSLEGFKERPILGWGQDNYFYVFAKHNDPRMYSQEPWFDRTHNVFMDWLIAGGILALLAYLALYFSALFTMWSNKSKIDRESFLEKALLTGLLVAYFIHNIFVFDNLISYILFFFVLAYISTRFGKSEKQEVYTESVNAKSKLLVFGPVVLVCLFFTLYMLNIKYINANRNIIVGLVPAVRENENSLDAMRRSLEGFEKAAKAGGIANMESREQMAQNTLSLLQQIRSANIPETEEYMPIYQLVSDFISSTKEQYLPLITIKNPDPRSLAIYSTFLRSVNENEEALKYGKMAHEFAPMKQTISTEYIEQLLAVNNFEEAKNVAQEMYDSDRSYEPAKSILALTYLYAGNFDAGEALLKGADGSITFDQSMVDAYKAQNKASRLIAILENNIKINKEDIASVVLLVSVYAEEGNNYRAIYLLNNLAKIKPELKPQIDEYIKSLK